MPVTITINTNYTVELPREQVPDWGVCWNFLEDQPDSIDNIDFPVNIRDSKGNIISFTDESIAFLQQINQGNFSLFTSDNPTEDDFNEINRYIFENKTCKVQDVVNVLILVNFMDNQKIQKRICGFIARMIRGKSADEIQKIFTE